MSKKRERKQTITQQIMQSVYAKLESYDHDLTRKQYARQTKQYIKFCREKYNVHSFEECSEHIQDYSDFLQRSGYSASTIHTYLSSVCAVFDEKLERISKPKRFVAEYKKGRNKALPTAQNDLDNPKFVYLTEFQCRVGLRRQELTKITGNDLVYDESGYLCVRVLKGKGGKMQLQRILDEDIEFIKSYFDRTKTDEYIFDKKLFKNDLNLHQLRAEAARNYYRYLIDKINADSSFRAQLEKEIKDRWNAMNRSKNGKIKPFLHSEMYGIYSLRGKNRQLAIVRGLSVHYDKTVLLATSIFKLSHWRNDVTIASYMLA